MKLVSQTRPSQPQLMPGVQLAPHASRHVVVSAVQTNRLPTAHARGVDEGHLHFDPSGSKTSQVIPPEHSALLQQKPHTPSLGQKCRFCCAQKQTPLAEHSGTPGPVSVFDVQSALTQHCRQVPLQSFGRLAGQRQTPCSQVLPPVQWGGRQHCVAGTQDPLQHRGAPAEHSPSAQH